MMYYEYNRTTKPINSQALSTVQVVFYITIFVSGGVGNILVLLVINAKKTTRKTNDYFILNLALGDILVLLISIPVDCYMKIYSKPSGILICKFLWPFMTLGLITSVFTLTCMAIERCRVICKPTVLKLKGGRLMTVIIMIWIAALLCVFPLVIVAVPDPRSYSCQEKWPSNIMRQIYTLSLFALQYVLPLIIISIAYAMISYQLKISKRFRICSMAKLSCTQLQLQCNENSKINKNLKTIVLCFAILMLPKHVVWLWLDFGQGDHYEYFGQVLIFAEVLLYIHSCSNPFVYGTIMKDYRAGFKRYLWRIYTFCWHWSLNRTSPVKVKVNSQRGTSLSLFPPEYLQISQAPGEAHAYKQRDTSLCLFPLDPLYTSPTECKASKKRNTLLYLSTPDHLQNSSIKGNATSQ